MRVCSYVVVHDKGFAPNPFGGFCTLAACTPNHQGLRLKQGDWLLGHSSAASGNRLIYAMRVADILDFDDYYRDRRFAAKKPQHGGWRERCGDNIYFRDESGRWAQGLTFHHTRSRDIEKDTRHPRVFVSDHFFYFGENAPDIPAEFASLIQSRQGCRCSQKPETVRALLRWLERTYSPGLHGDPRDREQQRDAQGGLIQIGPPRRRQNRA